MFKWFELYFRWVSLTFSWEALTLEFIFSFTRISGAPKFNIQTISVNICSEDDLRSRIFGKFVVKFLACLLLLEFSNI